MFCCPVSLFTLTTQHIKRGLALISLGKCGNKNKIDNIKIMNKLTNGINIILEKISEEKIVLEGYCITAE